MRWQVRGSLVHTGLMAERPTRPEPGHVVVFVTSWCPFCTALRSGLDELDVPYDLVDITEDTAAATFVESVNGGDRTVPTVLFPDASTLTNPTSADVARRLG